ncbi:hypothetical protein GWK47_025597 [Chionoecetes opilio]|uniref:Uncharacterized protein n=1 Tax=Chionoecetes opilio TaxID=41210 RepID=A0A8J8WAZ8_CHIOP|nr:hypothetical protein GWK47_025597 [Chionoecetes opilio]
MVMEDKHPMEEVCITETWVLGGSLRRLQERETGVQGTYHTGVIATRGPKTREAIQDPGLRQRSVPSKADVESSRDRREHQHTPAPLGNPRCPPPNPVPPCRPSPQDIADAATAREEKPPTPACSNSPHNASMDRRVQVCLTNG